MAKREREAPERLLTIAALAARWGTGRSTVVAIPFAELPYSVSGGEQVTYRHYREADVESYEARTTTLPGAREANGRTAHDDASLIREIRAMRAKKVSHRKIGAELAISSERVQRILLASGGDTVKAQQLAARAATFAGARVPVLPYTLSIRRDRMIDALRACAARHGGVPPAEPTERFRELVGLNPASVVEVFGSLSTALRTAGLSTRGRRAPTRPTGNK